MSLLSWFRGLFPAKVPHGSGGAGRRLAWYLARRPRYRVWLGSPGTPRSWEEIGARAQHLPSAWAQGTPAFAVAYPSGVLVELHPESARPPPGTRFLRAGDGEGGARVQPGPLREGEVEVLFGDSGPRPGERGFYSTSLRNLGYGRVRVTRFGAWEQGPEGLRLRTITGACFTASDFREWYAVEDREGWIPPGVVVTDPSSHGAPGALWAWELEREDGERFWVGRRVDRA